MKRESFTASWRSLSCKATSLTWTLKSECNSWWRWTWHMLIGTMCDRHWPPSYSIGMVLLSASPFSQSPLSSSLCMVRYILGGLLCTHLAIDIVIDHFIITWLLYCEHWPVLYMPFASATPSASASSPLVGPSGERVFSHLIKRYIHSFQCKNVIFFILPLQLFLLLILVSASCYHQLS